MRRSTLFLLLFLTSKLYGANCTPNKAESTIDTVCKKIQSYNTREEFLKESKNFESLLYYNDCGLASLIIYDSKPPYLILKHPAKYFFENFIRLEKTLSSGTRNPYTELATKALSENSLITINNIELPLSSMTYNRSYWAKSCKPKNDLPLIVSAMQTKSNKSGFFGSFLVPIDYEILNDSNLTTLLSTSATISSNDKSIALVKLATKVANAAYSKTADALSIPTEAVNDSLKYRVNHPTFLENIKNITHNFTGTTKIGILGAISDDLEKTISVSEAIKSIDKKRLIELIDRTKQLQKDLDEGILSLKNKVEQLEEKQKLKDQDLILNTSKETIAIALSIISFIFSLLILIKVFFY